MPKQKSLTHNQQPYQPYDPNSSKVNICKNTEDSITLENINTDGTDTNVIIGSDGLCYYKDSLRTYWESEITEGGKRIGYGSSRAAVRYPSRHLCTLADLTAVGINYAELIREEDTGEGTEIRKYVSETLIDNFGMDPDLVNRITNDFIYEYDSYVPDIDDAKVFIDKYKSMYSQIHEINRQYSLTYAEIRLISANACNELAEPNSNYDTILNKARDEINKKVEINKKNTSTLAKISSFFFGRGRRGSKRGTNKKRAPHKPHKKRHKSVRRSL